MDVVNAMCADVKVSGLAATVEQRTVPLWSISV